MDPAGKIVVVTGGANGIGRALCEAFAAAGAEKGVVVDKTVQQIDIAGTIGQIVGSPTKHAEGGILERPVEGVGGRVTRERGAGRKAEGGGDGIEVHGGSPCEWARRREYRRAAWCQPNMSAVMPAYQPTDSS